MNNQIKTFHEIPIDLFTYLTSRDRLIRLGPIGLDLSRWALVKIDNYLHPVLLQIKSFGTSRSLDQYSKLTIYAITPQSEVAIHNKLVTGGLSEYDPLLERFDVAVIVSLRRTSVLYSLEYQKFQFALTENESSTALFEECKTWIEEKLNKGPEGSKRPSTYGCMITMHNGAFTAAEYEKHFGYSDDTEYAKYLMQTRYKVLSFDDFTAQATEKV